MRLGKVFERDGYTFVLSIIGSSGYIELLMYRSPKASFELRSNDYYRTSITQKQLEEGVQKLLGEQKSYEEWEEGEDRRKKESGRTIDSLNV